MRWEREDVISSGIRLHESQAWGCAAIARFFQNAVLCSCLAAGWIFSVPCPLGIDHGQRSVTGTTEHPFKIVPAHEMLSEQSPSI